jgi:hypothetical protein
MCKCGMQSNHAPGWACVKQIAGGSARGGEHVLVQVQALQLWLRLSSALPQVCPALRLRRGDGRPELSSVACWCLPCAFVPCNMLIAYACHHQMLPPGHASLLSSPLALCSASRVESIAAGAGEELAPALFAYPVAHCMRDPKQVIPQSCRHQAPAAIPSTRQLTQASSGKDRRTGNTVVRCASCISLRCGVPVCT